MNAAGWSERVPQTATEPAYNLIWFKGMSGSFILTDPNGIDCVAMEADPADPFICGTSASQASTFPPSPFPLCDGALVPRCDVIKPRRTETLHNEYWYKLEWDCQSFKEWKEHPQDRFVPFPSLVLP